MIQRQILIAGLIALLLAIAIGYFAASALARRVKRLERGGPARWRPATSPSRSRSTPTTSWGSSREAFNEMQHRLARLDSARKEFIANASHELRTPIFSLGGFVELLQDEDLDEETRAEFLTTMREQVDRLQKLTTDLLDLSRLDAGSIDLELEPVPLRTLANQVAGEFAAAAARKGAEIEVVDRDVRARHRGRLRPGARRPDRAGADRQRARAHPRRNPHHDRGAARAAQDGPPDTAELLVSDDGPGIRRRDLAPVFERFHTQRLGFGLGPRARDRPRARAAHARGRSRSTRRPGSTVFTLTLPLAGEREHLPRLAPQPRQPHAEVGA